MPPKREFRLPKSREEEKNTLQESIPKSTRSSTKWAFKVFSEWQIDRANKDPLKEQCSFEIGQSTVIGYKYREYERRITELLADKVCRRSSEGQRREVSSDTIYEYKVLYSITRGIIY